MSKRLGIPYVTAARTFNWKSAYAAGLFDADGTIVLSVKKHGSQKNLTGLNGKIQRQIFSKPYNSLEKRPFGAIHFDKDQKGYYSWYISKRKD